MDKDLLAYQAKMFEAIFGSFAEPLPSKENTQKEEKMTKIIECTGILLAFSATFIGFFM